MWCRYTRNFLPTFQLWKRQCLLVLQLCRPASWQTSVVFFFVLLCHRTAGVLVFKSPIRCTTRISRCTWYIKHTRANFPCSVSPQFGILSVPERSELEWSRRVLFRRGTVRYWYPLRCRAIDLGKPPQAGVIFTIVYGTVRVMLSASCEFDQCCWCSVLQAALYLYDVMIGPKWKGGMDMQVDDRTLLIFCGRSDSYLGRTCWAFLRSYFLVFLVFFCRTAVFSSFFSCVRCICCCVPRPNKKQFVLIIFDSIIINSH